MIGPKVRKPTKREEQEAYELVALRDGERCVFRLWDCDVVVQRDHRRNRSQQGLTVVENLQTVCVKHHQWKTDHPDAATRAGWAVPGWADPSEFPAQRWLPTSVGTLRPAWVLYLPREVWPENWRPEDTFVEISDKEAAERIAGLRRGGAHAA